MGHAGWVAFALVLAAAGAARGDVIPPGHVRPPPPSCPEGAHPRHVGRGHGPGPCVATPCATDAECGTRGPCRETALCVLPEVESHEPREPGQERPPYRVAPLACAPDGTCPGSYECVRETRCAGRDAPASTTSPGSSGAGAFGGGTMGWCSVATGRPASAAAGAAALFAAAVVVAQRRRRGRAR